MARIHAQGALKRFNVLKARRIVHYRMYKGHTLYASKWPRKRGKPKKTLQKAWVDDFTASAKITKQPEPCALVQATAISPGTGWFYRDVLHSALHGKLFWYRGGPDYETPIPQIYIDQPSRYYEGAPRMTTPTARVQRLAGQSGFGGSYTTIIPTSKQWDNNQFWDSVSHPSRLVAKASGLYLFGAQFTTSTNAAGVQNWRILLNGTTELAKRIFTVSSATGVADSLQGIYYMTAGDYIEVQLATTASGQVLTLDWFYMVGITPEVII